MASTTVDSSLCKHSRSRQRSRAVYIQIHTLHDVIRKDWGPLGDIPTSLQANGASLGGGHNAVLQEAGPKVKQTSEFFTQTKILKLQKNHSN